LPYGTTSVLIALSGSFDVVLKMESLKKMTLNKPNIGLLIVDGIWRGKFSSGAVCLVLSSAVFDEADYIHDYKDFKLFKTDEPKPELVKTVFRINCFKIKEGVAVVFFFLV
jgi:hypothetical protein